MTATVTVLRGRDITTVQAAVDAFLASTRCANPNTRRGQAGVLDSAGPLYCKRRREPANQAEGA